jgi:hypothetical protein
MRRWLAVSVLLAFVRAEGEEVAEMRPCSESDIYPSFEAAALTRAARPTATLKGCSHLVLSGASLSSGETLELSQAIASPGEACNSTSACILQLEAIQLDGLPVGDSGATVLADALSPSGAALEHDMKLDLSAAQVGPLGAVSIAAALRNVANSRITSLSLDWNEQLGDEGAQPIGRALLVNRALRVLGLARCGIGEAGASQLAVGLQADPPSLTSLRLEGNQIGAVGAAALGTALLSNTHLTELGLALNPLSPLGALELREGLRRNGALRTLDLSGCSIGDDGAVAIATALRTNSVLETLYLQNNGIGKRGALALASTLRINRALRTLNLRLNHIGAESAAVLVDAMQHGEAAQWGGGGLRTLLLEYNALLPRYPAQDDEAREADQGTEQDTVQIPQALLEEARRGSANFGEREEVRL